MHVCRTCGKRMPAHTVQDDRRTIKVCTTCYRRIYQQENEREIQDDDTLQQIGGEQHTPPTPERTYL